MRVAVIASALAAAVLAAAPPALAADVQRADFRYVRALATRGGGGPVAFEPDGSIFAHSRPDLGDLRVLDAGGEPVAWRSVPARPGERPLRVRVLNSGIRGRYAVALLDLGGRRRVRDRVALDIPGRDFTGRAIVLGADRRGGPFTRLSVTGIYDVGGAQPARSTVAVIPPSDFRYLEVRATGIDRIAGAAVSGKGERPRLMRRAVRSVSRRQRGSRTTLTLDVGFQRLPVDELRIDAGDARYDRAVTILGSNDRRRFAPLASARIFRFTGSGSAPIALRARHRFIRIEIENGDDPPLQDVEVSAWSRSRAVLVEGGRPQVYTVLYGNPRGGAPSYDFARLPAHSLGLEHAVAGRLGPERLNPTYEPPPDPRSFAARHRGIVMASLALAALALGAAGLAALRNRA